VAAHTGTGRWATAHRWVTAMTCHPITANPTAGLFRGAPAVAYVLHTANHPAYSNALATLDRHTATLTDNRLTHAHRRIDHGDLPALREYDLISGLTGIGAYLLHRHHGGTLLHDVLTYLVRLTEPLHHPDGRAVPGWWTGHGPTDHPEPTWPGGHANLGLAHGITGPLALLALAHRHGVTVIGHSEAIVRICQWLDRWRITTDTTTCWPGTLSLAEYRDREVHHTGPPRPSWCYGTPGIARAQHLAATAVNDARRQHDAERVLAACITDDTQLAQLGGVSLCHGWAGLIHTITRAAADAHHVDLAEHLPRLRTRMEEHLAHHGPPDHAGLLDGVAGVDLAREGGPPSAPAWDACLLLNI
jgi:hypothetical protein